MNRCTDRKPSLTRLGCTLIYGQENAWKELTAWYGVNIEIKLGIFSNVDFSVYVLLIFWSNNDRAFRFIYQQLILVCWQIPECSLTTCLVILWVSFIVILHLIFIVANFAVFAIVRWHTVGCILTSVRGLREQIGNLYHRPSHRLN